MFNRRRPPYIPPSPSDWKPEPLAMIIYREKRFLYEEWHENVWEKHLKDFYGVKFSVACILPKCIFTFVSPNLPAAKTGGEATICDTRPKEK